MAAQKPKRNVKYNPDALKHLAPGKKPVEVVKLDAMQMTQLVLLENIRRQALEAQTNFFLKIAKDNGYPDGIRCNFEMDWNEANLRVTMLGKAQPAKLKGSKVKKEN
jgi:hypothetical protein